MILDLNILTVLQGDSGGPFVVKEANVWHIHGITSFASLCAGNFHCL
jgi:secreted trypsin-like serine protease